MAVAQRIEMVRALEDLRKAFHRVNSAWTEEMVDGGLGATDSYPFHVSFEELVHEMSDWCEAFTEELEGKKKRYAFWIDLQEDSDTFFWIFKQDGETVWSEMRLGTRDAGVSGLTEITEEQYDDIQMIWNDTRYDDKPEWRDHSRADDILDVVNTPT